ncbi:MAG: RHS repeat domain-containing protein [Bryobacteraceae bacterium]
MGQTISRSAGLTAPITQSYSYRDPANRLSAANEPDAAPGLTGWPQTYNYDAFGNRAVAAGSYMPNEGFTPSGTVASVFPASNNRLVRGAGDSYDGAGNQTAWATVPPSASGSWFTYDGENRLLTANVANQGGASFVYDGEGRRVQKISSSGAVTTYVHDAMGNLAAEYSTAAPAAAGTQYLTSDFLGSTRLITDASGNPVRCFDYLPFGEEIPAGMNGRSGCYETMGSPQYPSPPDVADQKFTGKERDAETGLDYFGARYFSAAQGRWTSPDWSEKPQPVPYAALTDPQTLNLYAYVRNNPLSRVDPFGHFDCTGQNAQKIGCQYIANWNAEHGISPSAKKEDPPAPGVPVKLPNGKTVPDRYSPTGVLMSPTSDLKDVAATGRAIKQRYKELMRSDQSGVGLGADIFAGLGIRQALHHNGDYDYQRVTLVDGDLQQLPQFRDVSNFNVGLLGQQAGLSLDELLSIVGDYAKHNSSNYSPDQPYGLDPRTKDLTVSGFQTGASGVYGQ